MRLIFTTLLVAAPLALLLGCSSASMDQPYGLRGDQNQGWVDDENDNIPRAGDSSPSLHSSAEHTQAYPAKMGFGPQPNMGADDSSGHSMP